ncbi:MAG: hypothetical protein D3906_11875 [Candidatus Electrothrix sp. AUS1_2]|nr:hypothetical protein [Candidatus Electrothrix sp. AUS1_2]
MVGREIEAGTVFPEYYLIETERFHDIINSGIDEWVYFFKNSEVRPEFRSRNIQAAAEKLDLLKMSEQERRAYEKYLVNRASEKDMIESAYDEGIEKGVQQGIEKGVQQGIEQGEKRKAVRIALNLIKKGVLDDQDISEITELSVEEINDLRQQ